MYYIKTLKHYIKKVEKTVKTSCFNINIVGTIRKQSKLLQRTNQNLGTLNKTVLVDLS